MKIDFVPAPIPTSSPAAAASVALATLVWEGATLSAPAAQLDAATGGAVSRALANGRFKGAKGRTLELVAPSGLEADRLLLVGGGPQDAMDASVVEHAAASAYQAVKASGSERLVLRLDDLSPELVAHAALGAGLAAYRFDRYRTTQKADARPSVAFCTLATSDPQAAQAAYAPLEGLAQGVAFARDLCSEPANVLHPEEFARRLEALERPGLLVEVLDEAELERQGFGLLLGVGRGSARESRLVVMRWRGGADPEGAPVAFVGKGVCFDTGGISIKPADGMEDMKWDMGGAAAVCGLMLALAARGARANVVGIVGLVENMPDGDAIRPGDVLTSLSGKTVEVINTDAEGRLVLADALWWCRERFKPTAMVDLATLTGAVITALGHDYAGLFSNNEGLASDFLSASQASGDLLWRMPLPAAYEKQIESPIADLKNVGGRPGGSITAALFLQHFTGDTPWAHLDVAGVVWSAASKGPLAPNGATGFGVRLLDRLVADRYEA